MSNPNDEQQGHPTEEQINAQKEMILKRKRHPCFYMNCFQTDRGCRHVK